MPHERVTLPPEPTPGVCSGPHCGRPILWVMTIGNARMPLDPNPHPDGNVVPVHLGPGNVRARILTGNDLPALEPAYMPHHRTCPDSEHYRRRKAATAPKCAAGCGIPLHPMLVEAGERYHVNCAPLDPGERQAARATATGEQLGMLDYGGVA